MIQHKGFTLIELVLIIVIIGVLAAAALPRMANLRGQAQVSANRGLAGQFRSAVQIGHTAWIAAGAYSGGWSWVVVDGNPTLTVNARGWRDVSANFHPSVTNCTNTWPTPRPQIVADSSLCTEEPCYVATVAAGASGNSLCVYTLNGTSNSITYDVYTGEVQAY